MGAAQVIVTYSYSGIQKKTISVAVFEHSSIKAVAFEWLGVSENCSAEDFNKVLVLMRKNGLKLYQQSRKGIWSESSKSDDQLLEWKGANLFWSKVSPRS